MRTDTMDQTAQSTGTAALQKACLNAHRACLDAAAQCLTLSPPDVKLHHLLRDGAAVTLMTAQAAIRESGFLDRFTQLCDEVCRACATALAPKEHDAASFRVAYATCLSVCDTCTEEDGAGESDAVRDEILEESFPASDPPPPPTEL